MAQRVEDGQVGVSSFSSLRADTQESPVAEVIMNCLEITFPKYFRDKGWANGIGRVQEEIDSYAANLLQQDKKIVFDLRACLWIDPIPAMSILLEVSYARHLGVPVRILLPSPSDNTDQNDDDPYQKSPNRLLLFIAREKIFQCFSGQDDGVVIDPLPKNGWGEYENLDVCPSYEDAHCIPMTLLKLPPVSNESFAKSIVRELLENVSSGLESKVSPRALERLTYKLRVAVQEAIHNAQEHAYPDADKLRNVVIYARYRTGGVGIDSANQAKFLACLSEENKHCPGLSSDWLRGRPGALEVFILDRGIGMISAFESGGQQIVARSGKAKNKFFTVMNNTFVLGMSAKKERQTQYGGLHLLNNILEETTDYVRAIEGDVWFGSSVPFKEGRKNPILTSNRATRKGLALHLRLGWKSQTDRGKNWAEFSQENDYKLWWEELAFSEQDCEKSFDWFRNQSIIDERFDHEAPVVIKGDGDWILWFVHPHRMKWDILSFLEKKVSPLATTHAKLAIVDIPSYEAGTYAEALSGFKFMGTQAWPKYFEYIILGTDQFRFSALQSKEYPHSKWGFSELHEEFSSLKISPPPISPKPKNLRLALVRWMKWHDSRRLWDEVASHKDMFIPKRIVWNEDVIISGYLDFEKTTHNHLCSDTRLKKARSSINVRGKFSNN